jgi:subtilisin-like proprotein convertase family protein
MARLRLHMTAAALVALTAPASASAGFYGGGPVTINGEGPAAPYPATIAVGGEQIVKDVNVRLLDFTHEFPDEVDVLLVGPGGQKVKLLSDAPSSGPAVNEDFRFDDQATGIMADATTSGTYRPTDYFDGTDDPFPAPAPGAPFGGLLSEFNQGEPNGSWSLYVVDDTSMDGGSIGSWSISTDGRPFADTNVSAPGFVAEHRGPVQVTVSRRASGNDALRAATVSYATEPAAARPATPGDDYRPVSGTLSFAPGEATKTFEVPLVDDRIDEPARAFVIKLTAAGGDARAGAQDTVTIGDDDVASAALRLGGRAVQRVLRQRGVVVTAVSTFAGRLTASGTISVPGGKAATLRLRSVRRAVTAGRRVRIKLGLSRKALAQVRRALRRKRRLTARVTVAVRSPAGRRVVATRRVTLKR